MTRHPFLQRRSRRKHREPGQVTLTRRKVRVRQGRRQARPDPIPLRAQPAEQVQDDEVRAHDGNRCKALGGARGLNSLHALCRAECFG